MAININSSINNLIQGDNLNQLDSVKKQAQQRLSSGQRINSAADDAAGLAIANHLMTQYSAEMQSTRNINDGISLTQVANGALGGITEMMGRMQELAVQASNATYSDSNRQALQSEYAALQQEIGRITEDTQFNGLAVIGSDTEFSLQLGDTTLGFATSDLSSNSGVAALLNSSIDTQSGASATLGLISDAFGAVGEMQTQMGALSNRLESAFQTSLESANQGLASRSRIADADMAAELSRYTSADILTQANLALRAQANQDSQLVSQLLG